MAVICNTTMAQHRQRLVDDPVRFKALLETARPCRRRPDPAWVLPPTRRWVVAGCRRMAPVR